MKLKMNKIWKMLVVVLVITTTACGQQRGGQEGPPALPTAKEIKTMVSDLSKEILLSDEQEAKVLKLYTAHFEEIKEKTSAGRPDRNEMEALKTSLEKEITSILSKDQQTKYASFLKKKPLRKNKM
ncbi:hypothetical protein SAMN04488006_0964 [Lutibacter maritimus]|jgi:predicted small lipoprotein YifL|uniref:LTXXQ motif family protein n=2 Tax=Lutibacter maritimus TaxID=593133 RepID=A0A1I6PEU0_9FLAO|nr:hypothetical protein SAMN04488006_0964 [Lutibacter maritimus]